MNVAESVLRGNALISSDLKYTDVENCLMSIKKVVFFKVRHRKKHLKQLSRVKKKKPR